MKLFGFLLIVMSSLYIGIYRCCQSRERLNALNSAIKLLEMMRAELKARALSIPKLSALLLNRTGGCAKTFLNCFNSMLSALGEFELAEIWSKAAEFSFQPLCKRELNILCSLGKVLGKYELGQQIRDIDRCIAELRDIYNADIIKQPELKSLSLGISACAGTILAILLI